MATVTLGRIPRGVADDMLTNQLNQLIEEIEWILTGRLDVKNIKANGIETKNLKAGSVIAEKIDVTELSAISADLGTITAGNITTSATINVGTDATIGNILNMGTTDYTGSKKIVWSSDTGTKGEIEVISGDMSIRAGGFITLTIGSSQGLVVNKKVTAPTFHATSGIDIGGIPVALSSAVSGTWYVSPTSGGSPTVALTFSNGVLVSAV